MITGYAGYAVAGLGGTTNEHGEVNRVLFGNYSALDNFASSLVASILLPDFSGIRLKLTFPGDFCAQNV